jgi:hypothetical protein
MGPIEPGIPLMDERRGRLPGPLRERMETLHVGDSFRLDTEAEWLLARGTVNKLRPKRFSIRKIPREGWRVWRVV